MTRQSAIRLLGAVAAGFIGKRLYAQSDRKLVTGPKFDIQFTNPGLILDLDEIAFVRVKYGGEEIEIARGELFNALKTK